MMTPVEEVRLLGWVQLRLWQRLGPRPSAYAVDVLRRLAELYRGGRCHAFLGEDDGTLRFVLADTELGGDAFTAFAGRPLAAVGDGVEGASVTGDDEGPLDPEAHGGVSRPSIYVLQCEEAILAIMLECLKGAGYDATGGMDAKRAIKAVTSGSYDLLLTCILNSGLNGLDVIEQVRSRNSELPIVVCTAVAKTRGQQALALGATAVVEKPYHNEHLLAVIGAALADG